MPEPDHAHLPVPLPRYLDVVVPERAAGPMEAWDPTPELVILGAGPTPEQALGPLTEQLHRTARGVVPPHALYLNTARLPASEDEQQRLILTDPFLHAIYQLGRHHEAGRWRDAQQWGSDESRQRMADARAAVIIEAAAQPPPYDAGWPRPTEPGRAD